MKTLLNEGPSILGKISEYDYIRIEERLRKVIKGPEQSALKPKAASKMIVSELKEELEAQGLPTDGTRNVLYQRVQKARRINRSRGRPLWVPPVEEEEEEVNVIPSVLTVTSCLEISCKSMSFLTSYIVLFFQVDEELDELISRIKLHEGNTEFWKRRFLGEGLSENYGQQSEIIDLEPTDVVDDNDAVDDIAKEAEDDEAEDDEAQDEEEEVEQTESQPEIGDRKDKEVEAAKPLQMIGVQLLKDSDLTASSSKKSRRRLSRVAAVV